MAQIYYDADADLKALEGNYNETYLFMLKQNLDMWKQHQQQLQVIDQRIALLLTHLVQDKPEVKKEVLGKGKPIRHHAPQIKNLHAMMVQLFGVNVSSISGINDYTLLRLIGETGVDMDKAGAV